MTIAYLVTLGLGNYGGGVVDPVAAPTLAVADNEDGTGAVATITDSTAATTNTLYSQLVDGPAVWTSRGSRSGDGTIAVSLTDLGYYFWKVVSTDGTTSEVSNIDLEPISDATVYSVHERCMQAIATRLRLLTFAAPESGDAPSVVVVAKIAADLKDYRPVLPCVIVGLTGKEQVNAQRGTNERDEVVFPVAVVIWAKDDGDLVTNRAAYTKWREQIFRALNKQRLVGVSEVLEVDVAPSTIIPIPQWLTGVFASAMQVNARAWLTRGLT